jgi:hypothetical protein
MATTVRFTAQRQLEITHEGRTVVMDVANFCAIDGELHNTAARAMEQPGTDVPVPAVSFAKGLRPRNYGAYGCAYE